MAKSVVLMVSAGDGTALELCTALGTATTVQQAAVRMLGDSARQTSEGHQDFCLFLFFKAAVIYYYGLGSAFRKAEFLQPNSYGRGLAATYCGSISSCSLNSLRSSEPYGLCSV
ncbi:unnamed protein product [Knipowitschia caucasica]